MLQTNIYALVVEQSKLDTHVGLEVVQAGPVVERTELTVGDLSAGTPSGGKALATAGRPHGHDAVVLAAGSQNDGLGLEDLALAVVQAEAYSTNHLIAVLQQIHDTGAVHELHANLLSGTADVLHVVQLNRGQSPGEVIGLVEGTLAVLVHTGDLGQPLQSAETAVLILADLTVGPAVQILQAVVHVGSKLQQGILLIQMVANVSGVILDKVLGLAVAQSDQNAGAAVGLTSVTCGIFLHDGDVHLGMVFLGGNGSGHTGQTAAHNQKISLDDFAHFWGPPSMYIMLSRGNA